MSSISYSLFIPTYKQFLLEMSLYFFITNKQSKLLFESFVNASESTDIITNKQFLLQFVGYASLDIIDQCEIANEQLFHPNVDRFEDLNVSCYVSLSGLRIVVVHELSYSNELLKEFLYRCHELVLLALINPFFSMETKILPSDRLYAQLQNAVLILK